MQDNDPRRRSGMVLQWQQRRRSSLLSLQGSVRSLVVVCQLMHHPTVGGDIDLRRTYWLRLLIQRELGLSFRGNHLQGWMVHSGQLQFHSFRADRGLVHELQRIRDWWGGRSGHHRGLSFTLIWRRVDQLQVPLQVEFTWWEAKLRILVRCQDPDTLGDMPRGRDSWWDSKREILSEMPRVVTIGEMPWGRNPWWETKVDIFGVMPRSWWSWIGGDALLSIDYTGWAYLC